MTGNTGMPDVEVVTSWPQAIVALAVIIVIFGGFNWTNYRAVKEAKELARKIDHQVHPNSGKSLADSVYRIEKNLETVQEVQAEQGEKLNELQGVQQIQTVSISDVRKTQQEQDFKLKVVAENTERLEIIEEAVFYDDRWWKLRRDQRRRGRHPRSS